MYSTMYNVYYAIDWVAMFSVSSLHVCIDKTKQIGSLELSESRLNICRKLCESQDWSLQFAGKDLVGFTNVVLFNTREGESNIGE